MNPRYQHFSQYLSAAVADANEAILFDWNREDLFEIGKIFADEVTRQFGCDCSIEKDAISWNYSIKLFTRRREVAACWEIYRSESGFTASLRWKHSAESVVHEVHSLGPVGLSRALRASLLNDGMLTLLSKLVSGLPGKN